MNPLQDPALADGVLEERRYILQNWRYDVIAVVASNGSLIERRRYDAYGRPISVSPADVGAQGGVEGTDGYLSNNDAAAYNTLYFGGQVKWSTDLGDGSVRRPSGTLNSSDYARLNDYFNEGYTGGLGLVSDAAVDLRRGYAGYQYDEILAGSGIISDKIVSRYHVRHRVLSSDDGKWNRRDPMGFVDGMGLYDYVRSGPMGGVDAMGLCKSCNQLANFTHVLSHESANVLHRGTSGQDLISMNDSLQSGYTTPYPGSPCGTYFRGTACQCWAEQQCVVSVNQDEREQQP